MDQQLPSNKRIFVFSPSQLNTIQACDELFKNRYVLKLRPMQKAEPLEKGSLMHEILAAYYKAKRLRSLGKLDMNVSEIVDKCSILGRVLAPQFSMSMERSLEVIANFRDYCSFWSTDGYQPVFVEQYFSKVIYEDDSYIFLFEGIADLVADIAGQSSNDSVVVDHKTTSRSKAPHPLNNQFIGECWALERKILVKNEIGFQSSYQPKDRFKRFVVSYSQSVIDEWVINTALSVKRIIRALEDDIYIKNFTACDKFGSCEFTELCNCTPDAREWKMKSRYIVSDDQRKTQDRIKDMDENPFLILDGLNPEHI